MYTLGVCIVGPIQILRILHEGRMWFICVKQVDLWTSVHNVCHCSLPLERMTVWTEMYSYIAAKIGNAIKHQTQVSEINNWLYIVYLQHSVTHCGDGMPRLFAPTMNSWTRKSPPHTHCHCLNKPRGTLLSPVSIRNTFRMNTFGLSKQGWTDDCLLILLAPLGGW